MKMSVVCNQRRLLSFGSAGSFGQLDVAAWVPTPESGGITRACLVHDRPWASKEDQLVCYT